MSDYENEVKKAEAELNQSLAPLPSEFEGSNRDEFLGDIKVQAQEYGQKIQDAAVRARDYASDKFRELQDKDPKQLVEDAKQFAREKPGQTILISAAVGLVLGLLLKRR